MDIKGIKEYLLEMQKLCIKHSGSIMCAYDIECHLESQEFREKFGVISLGEVINMLIQN